MSSTYYAAVMEKYDLKTLIWKTCFEFIKTIKETKARAINLSHVSSAVLSRPAKLNFATRPNQLVSRLPTLQLSKKGSYNLSACIPVDGRSARFCFVLIFCYNIFNINP